jgi:replicative DNA helicase
MAGESKLCFAKVPAEVFENETPRVLYEAARTLAGQGRPFGALSVTNFLDRAGTRPGPVFAALFEQTLDFEGLPSWTIRDGMDKLLRSRHRHDLRVWHELGVEAAAPEMLDPPPANGVHPFEREEHPARVLADHLDAILTMRGAVPTKIAPLDRLLGGGILPGELFVVGARTGVGKTALLCQVALNSLLAGLRVGYFSAEMSAGQILGRMALSRSEDPERSAEFAHDLVGSTIRVYDRCSQVAQVAHECQAAGRFDVVFIDHLSIFRDPSAAKQGRVQEVSAISRDLKLLAGTLECPIVAACQLNRQPTGRDDGRPKLSDLRDSGSIEQDSDQVLLLHDAWRAWNELESVKKKKASEPPRQRLEGILAKNRRGETGVAILRFERYIQRIEAWESDEWPENGRGE